MDRAGWRSASENKVRESNSDRPSPRSSQLAFDGPRSHGKTRLRSLQRGTTQKSPPRLLRSAPSWHEPLRASSPRPVRAPTARVRPPTAEEHTTSSTSIYPKRRARQPSRDCDSFWWSLGSHWDSANPPAHQPVFVDASGMKLG